MDILSLTFLFYVLGGAVGAAIGVVPFFLYVRKLYRRVNELETGATLQADLIVDLALGLYDLDKAGNVGSDKLNKAIAERGKGK